MAAFEPTERFDDVLLNIAGQCGGIEPLFDTVFSFLLRKTDYFHVMKPGDNIGFKAGVAQQLLLRSFSKFEQAAAAAELAAAEQRARVAAQEAQERYHELKQQASEAAILSPILALRLLLMRGGQHCGGHARERAECGGGRVGQGGAAAGRGDGEEWGEDDCHGPAG